MHFFFFFMLRWKHKSARVCDTYFNFIFLPLQKGSAVGFQQIARCRRVTRSCSPRRASPLYGFFFSFFTYIIFGIGTYIHTYRGQSILSAVHIIQYSIGIIYWPRARTCTGIGHPRQYPIAAAAADDIEWYNNGHPVIIIR